MGQSGTASVFSSKALFMVLPVRPFHSASDVYPDSINYPRVEIAGNTRKSQSDTKVGL